MNAPGSQPLSIEDYLDDLVLRLANEPPRRLRHLIGEAEAHLHDHADDLIKEGMSVQEAELRAIEAFGSTAALAEAERHQSRLRPLEVLFQAGLSAMLLGGVGAVAVGLSGLVAAIVRFFGGTHAIADVSSGPALTAANCTRWISLAPTARSCREAALGDWANETVYYRIALGLLGVIALLAYPYVRRGARRRGIGLLPRAVRDTIAFGAFGIASVWTLGLGVDATVLHFASGQWFSAAAIAIPAAAYYGVRLIRDLQVSAAAYEMPRAL